MGWSFINLMTKQVSNECSLFWKSFIIYEQFHHSYEFSLMSFHHESWIFHSQIIIIIIKLHQSKKFLCEEEFPSWRWIFIKFMILYENDKYSSKIWHIITLLNIYHINAFSSKWKFLTQWWYVTTLNNLHLIDEFSLWRLIFISSQGSIFSKFLIFIKVIDFHWNDEFSSTW